MKTSLLTLASALPLAVAQHQAGTSTPPSSVCPLNYPSELNTTAVRSGLLLHVSSNNPLHNNRPVQLRADPDPRHPGQFLGGVDAASPVLLANLRGGSVESQAQDWSNNLYGLGATAYLEHHDTLAGTARFTFGFANATNTTKPDGEWALTGASEFGWYGLYHAAPLEVSHGFIICEVDADGPLGASSAWWRLFYVHNGPEPVDFPGCEYVGVSTTVPAEIYNGDCNIGGYYAE